MRRPTSVRFLGPADPAAGALLVLVGAVAVASDRRVGGPAGRRSAWLRSGRVLVVAMLVLREVTLNGVYGDDELTDEEVRGAVARAPRRLLRQALQLVAAARLRRHRRLGAAAALDPEERQEPLPAAARAPGPRRPGPPGGAPRAPWARSSAGFVIAFEPDLALSDLIAPAGGRLPRLLGHQRAAGDAGGRRRRQGRSRGAPSSSKPGVGIATAAAVVVAAIAIVLHADPPQRARTRSSSRWRAAAATDLAQLCSLPANRALFAGTHNSFSAADSPGWLIANQRRNIASQLRDGIRLFLIDPHWGVEDDEGRVRTDFEAEGRDRNRVAKNLPPKVLAAVRRLTGRVGLREEGGRGARVWLCHTTCELGATRMSEVLDEFRGFLDRNRGRGSWLFFVEPYVPPAEIDQAFPGRGPRRPGGDAAAQGANPDLGPAGPGRHPRLIVFTENDGGTPVPWYIDSYAFRLQHPPLGATRSSAETACAPNRGEPQEAPS